MYFYVDESGHTGHNLFDNTQQFLYYGTLSSTLNLDMLARKQVASMREKLGVERLHANELGNEGLCQIIDQLLALDQQFRINFDFYAVAKADYALITFFDQVFDQGMNPAIPWSSYWTPLKYILLLKLASLFDENLLVKAWSARITFEGSRSHSLLIEVCKEIVDRIDYLKDQRSREIIADGLKWAIQNPDKINYHVGTKKEYLQISPNLIGFQMVLHGIAYRQKQLNKGAKKIIVDRQSQFNVAQNFILDLYQRYRDIHWQVGPGLPIMDLKDMPEVGIECLPTTQSIGLELVDLYIWIYKRTFEKKYLAPELSGLLERSARRHYYDEVSLDAISRRWATYFANLPEPTEQQLKDAKELIAIQESRRKEYVVR